MRLFVILLMLLSIPGLALSQDRLVVAEAVCVDGEAIALRDLRTLRGRDDATDSQRFLTYTSATIAGFSILAIVWVALPAAILPPCR